LDLDLITVFKKPEPCSFSGKAIQRPWYKSQDGRLIHANVNARLNIAIKVVPGAFSLGIEGIAVYPFRVTPGKVT
jgi:hypothetical protein